MMNLQIMLPYFFKNFTPIESNVYRIVLSGESSEVIVRGLTDIENDKVYARPLLTDNDCPIPVVLINAGVSTI